MKAMIIVSLEADKSEVDSIANEIKSNLRRKRFITPVIEVKPTNTFRV